MAECSSSSMDLCEQDIPNSKLYKSCMYITGVTTKAWGSGYTEKRLEENRE